MAATVSPGIGGSDELFAEPAEALPLIAQGATVGAKAATGGATHAASSLPGATAGSTPFDAAVQAALIALLEQDAAASMASATSSSTHAAGADASVASVVTEEAQSTQSLTRVGEQVSGSGMYRGYAATMPPAASMPSTGGGSPAGAGGGSSPVAGSMMRPPVVAPAPTSAAAAPTPAQTVRPLANTQPNSPAPTQPPLAQLADPRQAQHGQTPQPPLSTEPPRARPSAPPAPGTPSPAIAGPPAPTSGPPLPAKGPSGVQLLGFGPPGLGPVPQAPPFPIPLDPEPRPPLPDPKDMNQQQLNDAWKDLAAERDAYNADRCGRVFQLPAENAEYNSCLSRWRATTGREAALRQRYRDLGIPEPPSDRAPGPNPQPGTHQPAPGQPGAPGSESPAPTEPPPAQPASPSVAEQATQIGEEVKALPKGSGQLPSLADKVTALHLDQQQAAEATDIAAKVAFGETAGIANLPNGIKVVLPARIDQGVALMVNPDGSVTVFRGDLLQFLPYLGR